MGYYDALSLSYDTEVQAVFKKAYMLRYIDLSKLKKGDQTTCFLVNLSNLLWIHALFSFNEGMSLHDDEKKFNRIQYLLFSDFHDGLCYKNWCLRQIYYNMVGYKVGDMEFISLFDLHGVLLNYPTIFRTDVLNRFHLSEDARLHSIVCQPYIFSPKVTVKGSLFDGNISREWVEKLIFF